MGYGKGSYGRGSFRKAPAKSEEGKSALVGAERSETPDEPARYEVHGRKASILEDRVYRMLLELNWTDDQIEFQVDVMGGRLPGGQVLDFVLWGYGLPIVLDVRGDYWHAIGRQVEEDRAKEAAVFRAWRKPLIYHTLYQADLETDEIAYTTLLQKVGRGGGPNPNG